MTETKKAKPKKTAEEKAAELFSKETMYYHSKYGKQKRAVFLTLCQFQKMQGNKTTEYDEPGFLVEEKEGVYKWMPKNLFELGRF